MMGSDHVDDDAPTQRSDDSERPNLYIPRPHGENSELSKQLQPILKKLEDAAAEVFETALRYRDEYNAARMAGVEAINLHVRKKIYTRLYPQVRLTPAGSLEIEWRVAKENFKKEMTASGKVRALSKSLARGSKIRYRQATLDNACEASFELDLCAEYEDIFAVLRGEHKSLIESIRSLRSVIQAMDEPVPFSRKWGTPQTKARKPV